MTIRIDIGEASEEILELDNYEIMEEFLAILEASGASRDTIKAYRSAITDFLEYLGDKPLRDVRLRDIIDWRNHRLRNGFRKGKKGDKRSRTVTLHYYNLFIRRFLKWLGIRIRVPNVKKPPRKIEVLTDEEIEKLYRAVRDPLDKLILDILLDTGLRSRELINLRVEDIDFKEGVITVKEAKYGKERKVLATKNTLEELRMWIKLNNMKKGDKVVPLTYSGLYKRIKRMAKRAGIPIEKIHPHILRHTFATRALKKGINIFSLQRLLGHTDIKTTQIYTHLTIEDIKKEYQTHLDNIIRCPNCRREIPSYALFCPYCGYSLNNKKEVEATIG